MKGTTSPYSTDGLKKCTAMAYQPYSVMGVLPTVLSITLWPVKKPGLGMFVAYAKNMPIFVFLNNDSYYGSNGIG